MEQQPTIQQMDAREAAYRVLFQVEKERAYANLALKQLLDKHSLSPADSRLAAQIVYGTARMQLALDCILAQLLTRPLDQLMPEVLVILRLSVYQLHYLDASTPYAVTDQAVRLAKRHANPALAKLVNGVLRTYLRKDKSSLLPGPAQGEDYLVNTLSYPRWLARYLVKRLGFAAAEQFCLAQNQPAGVYLRANPMLNSRDELIATLAEQGLTAIPAPYAPTTLRLQRGDPAKSDAFKQGRFTVQGAAAQLPALALAPTAGSRVLDLCAAPGGKTSQLAELMNNQGELHAFDVYEHKIPLIKATAQRLGLSVIKAAAANAALLPPSYREWADYILLDTPCSGLGVLNNRADSRYHHQLADINILAEQSYTLLDAACAYLKPGGRICYATCTITEQENEQCVRRLLAAHPEMELTPLTPLDGLFATAADKAAIAQGMFQLWPHIHGTEGFFIALLAKRAR